MADYNLDISFEEQKLQDLKSDIDSELVAVRALLRQVAEECKSDPAEDDSVLGPIKNFGNEMHTKWSNLCDAFDKVSQRIGDLFSSYNKSASKQSEAAKDMDKSL